jgi:4-hydroxy-3-methylbut-2-enyl diphosphate reductase
MLDLRVVIDSNSGFCFGVIYAIEMAEDLLQEQGYLYCLGDIVHNDEEVARLQAKGLIIINQEEYSTLNNETVLIRAHGEPPSTYQIALEQNIRLIDASCPVVLKLQNRIKKTYDSGRQVFIFGKEGHAEVVALKGQTNGEAVVFGNYNELDTATLPERVTLYSQTTKNTAELYAAREAMEQRGVKVDLKDTVCRQVSNRGEELKNFASKFDIILFVSGSKSSNGKMLYKSCIETNPLSYFISEINDIRPNWFKAGQRLGICGATSTPMWLMEQVKDYLLKL